MRIVAVDDEELLLEKLTDAIHKAEPEAEVVAFSRGSKLLAYVEDHPCDVAFLDIQMPGMKGVELARYLKDINPKLNIIFVTSFSDYKADAMDVRASGYIEKPVSAKKIRTELDDLRYEIQPKADTLLRIQCFGNFDVFDSHNAPVHFSRSKAKELFAYLVSRAGARCTTRELMGILFEDEAMTLKSRNYFQQIVSAMMKSLRTVGAEAVVQREYQNYSINTALVDCDYYRFREMDAAVVNSYMGEFMIQYSWAEFYTDFF